MILLVRNLKKKLIIDSISSKNFKSSMGGIFAYQSEQ